jgi:hypothetical protein
MSPTRRTRWVWVALAGLTCAALVACAPSHAGRTLGRGTLQIEGGLGGPFFTNFGGAIPVPNIPLGVRYGVTDRLDVHGHANILPLVIGGFLALDAGVTWAIVRRPGRDGINLATSASLALLTDFDTGARVVPFLDLAGGYTWNWLTAFLGAEVWLDFWGGGVAANPYVGVEFDIRRTTISLAGVWYNPGLDASSSAADYVSGLDRGGIGVQLGVKYRFDLGRRRRERRDD